MMMIFQATPLGISSIIYSFWYHLWTWGLEDHLAQREAFIWERHGTSADITLVHELLNENLHC